jgi:hypothetical protein
LKGGDASLLVSLVKQVNCKAHLLHRGMRHDWQANGLQSCETTVVLTSG